MLITKLIPLLLIFSTATAHTTGNADTYSKLSSLASGKQPVSQLTIIFTQEKPLEKVETITVSNQNISIERKLLAPDCGNPDQTACGHTEILNKPISDKELRKLALMITSEQLLDLTKAQRPGGGYIDIQVLITGSKPVSTTFNLRTGLNHPALVAFINELYMLLGIQYK